MRAVVRSLTSYEVDDLAGWMPEGSGWSVCIRVLAGPADGAGEESFDITVCSPAHLATRTRDEGVVDGRHHLVMEWFDWPALQTYIEHRVNQCEGATWPEVAEKLSRLGYWEFEDYRP